MNECSSPLKGFKIKYIYPNPKCPKLYLTWIRRHFLKFQSKSRILIYSQFSLFAVVMLYKVAANTEPLLLGEIHRFPRASKSQHLQSINILCVFLFKDTLIYTVDSLILNSWSTVIKLRCEQNLSNNCNLKYSIFLVSVNTSEFSP